jgi:hypothetical protein
VVDYYTGKENKTMTMNEKISEVVDYIRKNSSNPTKMYDLGNRKYYELEDPDLYDAVFGEGSGDAVEKLFGAGYSEMGRWCLEFKQYLEANPDTFKDPSKVIVLDSVPPSERGQE